MLIKLIRVEDNKRYGMFGILIIDGETFCVTLEPPDLNNKEDISCIPAGKYKVVKINTEKRGKVFMVMNVPNRTFIYIHAGNKVEHTEGCIILAQHFGKLQGNRAVLNSGVTYERFMNKLTNIYEFDLEISDKEVM